MGILVFTIKKRQPDIRLVVIPLEGFLAPGPQWYGTQPDPGFAWAAEAAGSHADPARLCEPWAMASNVELRAGIAPQFRKKCTF